MNIYSLDRKGLDAFEKDFKKTAYGKEQFYLSYSFAIIGLAASIVSVVLGLVFYKMCCSYCCCSGTYSEFYYSVYKLWFVLPVSFFLIFSIFAYLFGRIKFVKEIRKYAESKKDE